MAATSNTSLESLAFRVTALEMLVDALSRAANKTVFAAEPDRAETKGDPSHPRWAAALPRLDPEDERTLAEARRANAEAERVELEVAATRRALSLGDDSPLAGYSLSVNSEPSHTGERVLRISFDDGAGRTAVVALPFALALKLNSSIGRAVAERLDAAGER